MPRVDTRASVPSAPPLPMKSIWRTIRGYIWWSYERGTLHYDVMVTLILLFVFLSPRWINFNDKPVERNAHPTGLVVLPDKHGAFIYQIPASAVTAKDKAEIENQLRQIIEPISGAVTITKVESVKDSKGHIQSYQVRAQKE